MTKDTEKRKEPPRIVNRKARHEYHIVETVESGLELLGTEVKSLRAGQAKIDEAYARVRDGQAYLIGVNIASYPQAAAGMQHDPTRDRRLLLHRGQIAKLEAHARQKGNTIVPLALYFGTRGWAKVELGLVTGKQHHDKRQDIRKREAKRDIDRAMRKGK